MRGKVGAECVGISFAIDSSILEKLTLSATQTRRPYLELMSF